MKHLLSLALLSLGASSASAAITPFTYDFTSAPTGSTAGGRTAYTHSASDLGADGLAGRLNGGSLSTNYGFARSATIGSFAAGETAAFSVSFLTGTGTAFPTGANFGSIVIGSSSTAVNNLDNTNFEFTLRQDTALFGTGNAGVRLRSHDGATRTTLSSNGAGATFSSLAASTWYSFTVTLGRSANVGTPNLFSYELDLRKLSDDSVVMTATGGVTNASVANASQLYAGFINYVPALATTTAIVGADNFSAVPEPGSFAALAGLGALGFVAARRRRRA
jgi:hypothetical protein